jgi:hypothetical protein
MPWSWLMTCRRGMSGVGICSGPLWLRGWGMGGGEAVRRIKLPPDGCWNVSLRIWWGLFWQDGTPERCQRPVAIVDDEPEPRDEHADESTIGG